MSARISTKDAHALFGTAKRSKYGNRRVTVNGRRFDSIAESRRYLQLKAAQTDGSIKNLRCQVPFVLAPSVHIEGEVRARPSIRYVADFAYIDASGREEVEGVKGVITEGFRLKQHLMATVHGIHVRVVRK